MPWIGGKWYDTDPFGVDENRPLNPPEGWSPTQIMNPSYSPGGSVDMPDYGPVGLPPNLSGAASAYQPYASAMGLEPDTIRTSAGPFPLPDQPVFRGGGETYGITMGPGGPIDPMRWSQITQIERARQAGNPMTSIPSPMPAPPPSARPPAPTPPPSSGGAITPPAPGQPTGPVGGGPRTTPDRPRRQSYGFADRMSAAPGQMASRMGSMPGRMADNMRAQFSGGGSSPLSNAIGITRSMFGRGGGGRRQMYNSVPGSSY